MRRRHGAERPHVGELAFVAANGVLDQRRRNQVPVHVARGRQTLRGQSHVSLQNGIVLRLCTSRHHSLEKTVGVGPLAERDGSTG